VRGLQGGVGVGEYVVDQADLLGAGARVGVAWLRETCGQCAYCRRGRENLCLNARFTGYDHDGGYAEFVVVREDFAYAIPDGLGDEAAAPLLCAGIIGFRAIKRAEIRPGATVALVGPSGAGKSTLLHVAGLLERPDGGAVLIEGRDCGGLSDEHRTLLRRRALGFVYQFHHLLPEFSALENVMLPQMIAGVARRPARRKAAELLDRVGLAPRIRHRPGRLSGGEQQRVAIVRALANDPRILLADEPTGNLDHATGDGVLSTLLDLVRHTGLAALIATHNLELARRLDRIVALEDGRLKPLD